MPRVAVIGAGATGLKAAFDIVDSGDHTVVVYESRGRCGGRTRTSPVGGLRVDFGAESLESGLESGWVDEFRDRDVIDLNEHNLIDPFANVEPGLYQLGRGAGLRQTYAQAQAAFNTYFGSAPAEAARAQFAANTTAAADVAVARGADLEPLEARIEAAISGESAFSESIGPAEYSAQDLSRNDSPSLDQRPWQHGEPIGLGVLFERYGGRLAAADRADVRLNETVTSITPSFPRGWRVVTPGSQEEFAAAVVTLPVSVLVGGSPRFTPGIEAWLRRAFEGIELGFYLKVALAWPQAAERLPDRHHGFSAYAVNRDGTLPWHITKFAGSATLMAATVGRYAEFLEKDLGTAGIGNQVQRVVRALMPDNTPLPPPGQIARSTWATSPASLGAYSYSSPGFGQARPRLDLLDRHDGLFFGGEAFSLTKYGSLEAAFESGETVAAACLAYLG